jgi:rubredoxin
MYWWFLLTPISEVSEGSHCPKCKDGTMKIGYSTYNSDSGMYAGPELACNLCGYTFTPKLELDSSEMQL